MNSLPPLGLYVHLPWCERKCPYCDFNSHESSSLPEAAYIETLLADLRSQLAWVQGRPVATIFIGGGTPSLFSVASITRLMTGIADTLELAPDFEATLEANPGSAEAEKFAGYRIAGINRLSLGIQSFSDDKLVALGRVHDSLQAGAAIGMAKAAGFTNFNIDLMHGLPGQSPEDAVADLELALAFSPPHLSWYQLTIEPNTVYYKHRPTLPSEDALADIQDRGEQLLARCGYRKYEVSAYSKPGHQCRHNLNYWRFGDYLAIGAGAHGKLTGRDGAIRRYRKKRQPLEYLASPAGTRSRWQLLQREELCGEFMLNALRLEEGFSLTWFKHRTGLSEADLQPQLEQLLHDGLLQQHGERVSATELGGRFLDTVVSHFLTDGGS